MSEPTSDVLTRVIALSPLIEQSAEAIDRDRELTPALIEKLISGGFFRLLMPKWLGGGELNWPDYLEIIRVLAMADGSTAWCVNQACVFATAAARVPQAFAKEIWSDPRTTIANGPPAWADSTPVDGGYRLSGRWMFSSGCRHANWLAAVTVQEDTEKLLHMVPRSQVELIDVWDVAGLRGTGSFHFEINDQFVPTAHTATVVESRPQAGPLYAIPRTLLFACGFGCVALGVSRAGLNATLALAREKKAQYASQPLAYNPVVQNHIGQAEAKWRAAKALLDTTTAAVWERINTNGDITLEDEIELRMASTHAIRQSAEVIDILYNLTGSNAIFSSTGVQRRFQDMHAITQQIQGREAHYETVGQYHLGLEPDGVF